MTGQLGFWSIAERLAEISAQGDPLETLAATVDFEMFRPVLEGALGRPPRWKGGRPPFDAVLKFRMLVLQSLHGLSLEQTEYLVRDRLSWMRFCGLGPEDRVPDANTLWDFREALITAGALDALFGRLDQAITAAGYLPRGGQILDATLVAAPRQRNYRRGKGGDQGRQVRRRDLAREAREGAAEGTSPLGRLLRNRLPGNGWPLDGEVFKGEGPRRRHQAGRYRDPRIRLQEPRLHRPDARPDPPPARHGRSEA